MKTKVLSLLVDNTAGVLSRVSGMFSRRGYNIDSFSAGVTTDPRFTRMTIVTSGDEQILEQILGEMKLEIYGQMPAQFKCNCSRERVEKALIALGRAELSHIIADGKPETLNCSFCNTNYTFTVDEMKEILAKCTH